MGRGGGDDDQLCSCWSRRRRPHQYTPFSSFSPSLFFEPPEALSREEE